MNQHRVFCTTRLKENTPLTLDGQRAHYLGHVLRIRVDDTVVLFDGSGPEFTANVTSVSRKKVELTVGSAHTTNTDSPLKVVLIQSLLRGERMDFCVQKATELGVTTIAPVFTERTVFKIPKERAEKRRQHWQAIAVSACEQSGRTVIPDVLPPQNLMAAVTAAAPDSPVLVLDPWADACPLPSVSPAPKERVAVCIGPEGGYSDHELESLRTAGAISVTCGPRVLRSETAGIVAVAACQMLWGDWQG
ncbi:MAG: 16S rRNA (uracil(1498)-N(3))-methyltransferase [Gammaproteobacteria bacterium]